MMTVDAQLAGLHQHLGRFISETQNQDEILAKCHEICFNFNLSAEELYYKWEAYSMRLNPQAGLSLSLEQVDDLKKQLQVELERKSSNGVNGTTAGFEPSSALAAMTGTPFTAKKARVAHKNLSMMGVPSSASPVTPMAKRAVLQGQGLSATPSLRVNSTITPMRMSQLDVSSSSPNSFASSPYGKATGSHCSTLYSTRKDRNTRQETLNKGIVLKPNDQGESKVTHTIRLQFSVGPREYEYKYMFETLRNRSQALDDLIEAHAERYAEELKGTHDTSSGEVFEFGDPSRASPQEMHYVGRIHLDTATAQGKLNEQSILLEASRRLGGKRVRLNLEDVLGKRNDTAIFPGQIVCVKGTNVDGKAVLVREVIEPIPPPFAASSSTGLLETCARQSNNKIIVAGGPYTLNDDLAYEPLEDLCNTICEDAPDFVVMLGPFVDRRHPLLKAGNVDEFPEDIFRRGVLEKLDRVVRTSPSTTIIMVPSTNDLVSEHLAYPQAPLSRELCAGFEALTKERIRLAPNPVIFSLDEVTIAVSSADALLDLSREELFRPGSSATNEMSNGDSLAPPDRLARLTNHMIHQHSFYPIFPASTASELPLDISHHSLLRLQVTPDIMITPSQLKSFAKASNGCVLVNPGHLAKKQAGGTYAKLVIRPLTSDEVHKNTDAGECEHLVDERTRVEIIKI